MWLGIENKKCEKTVEMSDLKKGRKDDEELKKKKRWLLWLWHIKQKIDCFYWLTTKIVM